MVLVSLKAQLKKEFGDDFHIETAESGGDAAEIIEELTADGYEIPLVISDQIMPGMRGVDLLIRIHELLPSTRTVMLTGQADADAVGMAINKANLFRYIAKPWDETDLCMTVKEAIRSYDKDVTIEQQNQELQILVNQLKEYNENLENTVKIRTREVEQQRDKLQTANKELTDSIIYASLIQQAVLTPTDILRDIFPDFFIFNRPRNIVSGDFYWFHRVENILCVVAADCTGHGVPGAFMSMLGITLLNEIAGKQLHVRAHEVLNEMRLRIKKTFQNSGTKDGVDMSLCMINTQTLTMQYAGAFNPIYIYRNTGESTCFFEFKADRFPLGSHPKDNVSFSTHDFQLLENDSLYMFSDGYSSQFGGNRPETFRSTRFKEKLSSIQHISMSEQKTQLINTIEQWQGAIEQIDDILILGIRINPCTTHL